MAAYRSRCTVEAVEACSADHHLQKRPSAPSLMFDVSEDDDKTTVLSMRSSMVSAVSASSDSDGLFQHLEELKQYADWSEDAKCVQRAMCCSELRLRAATAQALADEWNARVSARLQKRAAARQRRGLPVRQCGSCLSGLSGASAVSAASGLSGFSGASGSGISGASGSGLSSSTPPSQQGAVSNPLRLEELSGRGGLPGTRLSGLLRPHRLGKDLAEEGSARASPPSAGLIAVELESEMLRRQQARRLELLYSVTEAPPAPLGGAPGGDPDRKELWLQRLRLFYDKAAEEDAFGCISFGTMPDRAIPLCEEEDTDAKGSLTLFSPRGGGDQQASSIWTLQRARWALAAFDRISLIPCVLMVVLAWLLVALVP